VYIQRIKRKVLIVKTLYLTLKKKWFDMIVSGVKKEEYRESKVYWLKRLVEDTVQIGYSIETIVF